MQERSSRKDLLCSLLQLKILNLLCLFVCLFMTFKAMQSQKTYIITETTFCYSIAIFFILFIIIIIIFFIIYIYVRDILQYIFFNIRILDFACNLSNGVGLIL